jgi:hypothetical protein
MASFMSHDAAAGALPTLRAARKLWEISERLTGAAWPATKSAVSLNG